MERGDRGGVAWAGEVERGRFGGGLRVVALLALAISLAAGPEDLAVLVTPDVDLAFPARERQEGELLDQALSCERRPGRTGCKGAEVGAGDHVLRVSPAFRLPFQCSILCSRVRLSLAQSRR
ncbi:hypothetical protein [Streptomyces exfoliatus]|uniref:hypothetical protein n=1 Tax=Streptomyces exfoliatus TaxID=1905 RepID=UPI003F4D505E